MNKALATVCCLSVWVSETSAEDWPMWRHDAERSAVSPDEIAPTPTLLWSRKLPPPRQAWPLEVYQRLSFDASYEPVVMGKLLFLGSQNDGSVTAYDTDTGAERWKFYTEGPIRCAPACWNDRLYAGSDDGYLYCLDAQRGHLLWKFRGAPPDRPDRRHLGNGHLVSFWAVRGGPVVAGGFVYFGAGIWPTLGVFLHALDAGTGKAKWTNAELNYITHVRRDHEFFDEDSGLSPQGHLVAISDRLVVPCGRSMPAGLDLATGKLIYYVKGARHGDSRVVAHGQHAFVGKNAVVSLYDFREVTSPWAGRGGNKPEGYKRDFQDTPMALWECPMLPYKYCEGCEVPFVGDCSPPFTACDASSAYADGVAYSANRGTFYAHDVAHAKLVQRELNWGGKVMLSTWTPALVWEYRSPHAGPLGGNVIKAGKRLYGHAGRKLIALENLSVQPSLAWEKDLDGTPTSLIAADDKLFVATTEGGLYCFGQADRAATAKTYSGQTVALEATTDAWAGKAEEIVKTAGVKAGYCLVLGLKDGRLVEELLKQTEFSILGVDSDADKINRLRRHFDAASVLGSRVELFTAAPFDFGFPPYIASLIVSEDPTGVGLLEKADAARLFHSLHPYGGALCLDLPADAQQQFDIWAKGATQSNAVVKHEGKLALLVCAGALPGSAPWTHEAADAACTYCSQDDLVKAPMGILWYGDQNGYGLGNHGKDNVRPQVNNGRVYGIKQCGRKCSRLFAYDAYTGRFLGMTEIKCSYPWHTRTVAQTDGILLIVDGTCLVFDPATGKPLNTFTFNAAGATNAKDIRVDADTILVACDDMQLKDIKWDEYLSSAYFNSTTLVCLDRKSGAELWRRVAKDRFHNRALAMWEGLVFCVDAVPISLAEHGKQPAGGLRGSESTLYALDARTGREVWTTKIGYKHRGIVWASRNDWLACSPENGVVVAGKYDVANAWEAKTGKPLWANKKMDGQNTVIARGKTLIDQGGVVYDVFTGERTGTCATQRVGCNYMTGSKHLLVQMDESVSYVDLDRPTKYRLRSIRSGCINNIIPADGLLNVLNFVTDCVCNLPIQTSFAMVHMPEVAAWAGTTPLRMTPPPVVFQDPAVHQPASR